MNVNIYHTNEVGHEVIAVVEAILKSEGVRFSCNEVTMTDVIIGSKGRSKSWYVEIDMDNRGKHICTRYSHLVMTIDKVIGLRAI